MRSFLHVPQVEPAMLNPGYWLARTVYADDILLSAEEIVAYNARAYRTLGVDDMLSLQFNVDAALAKLAAILDQTLYDGHGQPFSDADKSALLPEPVRLKEACFGITVRRTSLRAFPTWDVASTVPLEIKTDMFQETAIDVADGVIVLASVDDWLFCRTRLYYGWLPETDVAFTDFETMKRYHEPKDFVIVTASRGLVGLQRGGGITPQMGTRLPLVDEDDRTYRVRVPTRSAAGDLVEVDGIIVRQAEQFHRGYLPASQRTLLEHAFRLLGEPYAWGGNRLGIFGRDCSRYVKDLYALIGVIMPRNSSHQRQNGTTVLDFADNSEARKPAITAHAHPGDLIHMPGHVMMYIGHVNGEPYAIHDTGGEYMQVIVSTLAPYPDRPWTERVTHIVRVK